MVATVLLSPGVPMITAGDEFGRTQGGNNNAYCQDNEISWIDWDLAPWQASLLGDVQRMAALRSSYAVLRPRQFPTFGPVSGRVRLRWFDEAGEVMQEHQWVDPHRRCVQALLDTEHDGSPEPAVLLVIDGSADGVTLTTPPEADAATQVLLSSSSG